MILPSNFKKSLFLIKSDHLNQEKVNEESLIKSRKKMKRFGSVVQLDCSPSRRTQKNNGQQKEELRQIQDHKRNILGKENLDLLDIFL